MCETLQERSWDCVEAVELHCWMEEFLHRHKTFDEGSSSVALEQLFPSVADIRHTAVRRTRTDSVGIEKFLVDAGELVRVLKVEEYVEIVQKLRRDIVKVMVEQGEDTRDLQAKSDRQLTEIAVARAKLDGIEQAIKAELEGGMAKCRARAGLKVVQSIERAERLRPNIEHCEVESIEGISIEILSNFDGNLILRD